jgi:hypothetical protein
MVRVDSIFAEVGVLSVQGQSVVAPWRDSLMVEDVRVYRLRRPGSDRRLDRPPLRHSPLSVPFPEGAGVVVGADRVVGAAPGPNTARWVDRVRGVPRIRVPPPRSRFLADGLLSTPLEDRC